MTRTPVVLFHDGRVLLNNNEPFWQAGQMPAPELDIEQQMTVPISPGHPGHYQLLILRTWAEIPGVNAISPRQLMMNQGFAQFAPIGRAAQLVNWYTMHQYCGRCAAATELANAATVLNCPVCHASYYPRINPCVIVLVTNGDSVLLGRGVHRAANYFSCLAGFIEAGESAEEAVAREVFEESGVKVHNVRYVQSQSWPFPSQLMLGFFADYLEGEVVACPDELAEAGWFNINNLPATPSPDISVAGQLIRLYRQSRAS